MDLPGLEDTTASTLERKGSPAQRKRSYLNVCTDIPGFGISHLINLSEIRVEIVTVSDSL
jgi:hypothetical protein